MLTLNAWNHVAATYDSATGIRCLYVNGIEVGPNTNTPVAVYASSISATIGIFMRSERANLDYFKGLIDEVSFYNRALSPVEIQAISDAGSGGKRFTPVAPTITTQPANQTVLAGQAASFSVLASGTPPLSYQWQLAGTNLPAETNDLLTLTNLALNQASNYDVVIANVVGSVTSSPAILDVRFILVSVNGQPAAATMTAEDSATVSISGGYPEGFFFYTLDGSTPSASSTLYDGPITLTNSALVSAMSLSADFTQTAYATPANVQIIPSYNLQTSVIGIGTIGINPPGGLYESNSVVTLTACPGSQWAFDHWSGAVTGSENPLEVIMNGPRNVEAVFVPTTYPLTIGAPGGGSVTADGFSISPATYHPTGSVVTLTATASNGWTFMGWQGTASGMNNPLYLTIDQTNSIQAISVRSLVLTRSAAEVLY